jgi:hypothetical protein
MIGENNELKMQLAEEYAANLASLRDREQQEAMEQGSELRGLFEDNQEEELEEKEQANKDKAKSDASYYSAANTIGNALFEDSKLVSSGLAAMNTYEGVTKALAQQNWVAAAATGVAGLAQVQKILSTEKGSSGGGSDVGSAPVTEAPQQTSVTVSDTDASGESQSGIIVATADDIAIAFNELINGARLRGVIS